MQRSRIVSLFALSIFTALIATTAAAWTGPTGSPPNNNVAAPINTSSSGQVKTGDFATQGKLGIGTASPSASYKLHIESGTNWTSYFHNSYGGISFGPGNATWAHIYSDNAAQPIIHNTDVFTVTGGFSSYNGDLTLKTSAGSPTGTTRMTVRNTGVVQVPGAIVVGTSNQYGSSPLTVDTVNIGSGNWAAIINYNVGAPYGLYGLYSYGSTYALYGSGAVYGSSFVYASDVRRKHNIQNLENGLTTLMKLRPVSFTWNEDNGPDNNKGKDDIGFIAQEVQQVLPGVIHEDPKTTYLEVDYPRLIPVLTQAIQDQQKEIEALKARIEALEAKSQ